jgi:hypothetical protein
MLTAGKDRHTTNQPQEEKMIFDTDGVFEQYAQYHDWQCWGNLVVSTDQPRLGALATIQYENGDRIMVLMQDKHYRNARNYFESAWAKEGILRVQNDLFADEWGEGSSLPTKGIKRVDWTWVWGPVYKKGDERVKLKHCWRLTEQSDFVNPIHCIRCGVLRNMDTEESICLHTTM